MTIKKAFISGELQEPSNTFQEHKNIPICFSLTGLHQDGHQTPSFKGLQQVTGLSLVKQQSQKAQLNNIKQSA